MRFAIISDVHANLAALEAVVSDAHLHGARQFLCLGDMVGYGPQPAECVRRIRQLADAVVMGNHDAWSVRPVAWSRLAVSPTVIPGLRHAREDLGPEESEWLRQLPLTLLLPGVSMVHGAFHRPASWPYLDDAAAAAASFARQSTPIGFFGHTHYAGYWEEGQSEFIEPIINREVRLRRDCRYALNPGSVGNPRTPAHQPDPRAQYLLFNLETRGAKFRRVPYDVAATVAACKKAGLPEEMIGRIELGY